MSGLSHARAKREETAPPGRPRRQPLIGIDVVGIQRISCDLERWGPTFSRRVLTPAEHDGRPAGTPLALWVGSCLSAKEAALKVLGGRPPGWTWHHAELRAAPVAPLPAPVRELGQALDSGLGPLGIGFGRLHLAPTTTAGAAMSGAALWAAWAWTDRVVVSALLPVVSEAL